MQQPAVFFDRDGVLIHTHVRNGKPYAISSVDELQIDIVALPLITLFKRAGYKIVVVTNQPDVGNGKVLQAEVEAINNTLLANLPIDLIQTCYHSQNHGCQCRKPASGMLLSASEILNINLSNSIMIGDRSSDIVAGANVGCFTIFIDCGYNEPLMVEPNLIVKSLTEILHQQIQIRELVEHERSKR